MKYYLIMALMVCSNAIQLKYPAEMTGPNMGTAQDVSLTAGQKEAAAVVAEQRRDMAARNGAHATAMAKWKDETYKAIEHTWRARPTGTLTK